MLVVTSIGDQDSFSCSFSPMDSPYILTVGAVDMMGERIQGSNFGDCVDVHAPGESIPAPWIGSSTKEERTLSGSSASAAIITGMIAIVMGTLRSPDLLYYKTGRSIYERMLEIVREEDFNIFVRNIFLTGVRNEFKNDNEDALCLIQAKGLEDAVKEVATAQLLDIDASIGKPSTSQRLKIYKYQNHRISLENYYTD